MATTTNCVSDLYTYIWVSGFRSLVVSLPQNIRQLDVDENKRMHCIFDSFKFQKNTFGHLSSSQNRIASLEIMSKKMPGSSCCVKKNTHLWNKFPETPEKPPSLVSI